MVIKLEKATDKYYAQEDIVLIALVTAKIHTNLKWLRKKNSSPEEFGEKGITQLTPRDKLLAFALLLKINEFDPNNFYKPENLGEIALKRTQFLNDEDHHNLDSSLWNTSPSKVNAKDMHRALEELERIIGLKSVEKREIRKIAKRYQIKFAGRPSLYQFPNDLRKLKRIYSEPALAELIVRALSESGLADDLSFFLQGVIHSLLHNYQKERSEAAKKVFDIVTNTYPLSSSDNRLNTSDLNLFREYFLSIPEGDLNKVVREIAHSAIKTPAICLSILILSLLKIEE